MIKTFSVFLLVILVLTACIFRKERYTALQFTYNQNGQVVSLPLVVPKGFTKQEKTDTAGVTLQTFYYPHGAMLYAAFLKDTTMELQPFDKRLHQPHIHILGGNVYKGQDATERYYREIQQGNLRFGYRLVPSAFELQFDSATNFASLQKSSPR